jgi:hypothetical protein
MLLLGRRLFNLSLLRNWICYRFSGFWLRNGLFNKYLFVTKFVYIYMGWFLQLWFDYCLLFYLYHLIIIYTSYHPQLPICRLLVISIQIVRLSCKLRDSPLFQCHSFYHIHSLFLHFYYFRKWGRNSPLHHFLPFLFHLNHFHEGG